MMKILVPTDFSDQSEIAINFAVQLALKSNAQIILFHTYHVLIPSVPEMEMASISMEEMERISLSQLKKQALGIRSAYKKLDVSCISKAGFAADEIPHYAEEIGADLVIMGISGNGFIEEKIIGSNAVTVIQKSSCPVLAIPSGMVYKPIEKIVLAFDYQENINKKVFNKLKKILRVFNPEILILNVLKQGRIMKTIEEAASGLALESYLTNVKHSFHFVEGENVEEKINQFIQETDAGLLVMIPHKHTLFERIFYSSHTKKMAFHSSVPLLTIRE